MVERTNDTGQERNEPGKGSNSRNKTDIINNETEGMERDKNDFICFNDYHRRLKKVKPGRLKINKDKNGEEYASIQLKKGDCPERQTERNELWLDRECDFEFNKDFKYKFSFKIPKNFPLSPTRLVIGQWKYNKIEESNEKEDPSPILAQRMKKINGKYYFVITDGTKQKNILGKIPFDDIKGKWVDMSYEVNFSDKTDENNKPIPCKVKIKANIEGEGEKEIYNGEFNLAEENNLQFNPKKSHSGYFKFGLYRDNYDYALTKNLSKEEKDEIEHAKNTENDNPMEIYFKNFSIKEIHHEGTEKEIDRSREEDKKKAGKLLDFYNSYMDTILAIKSLENKKDISENIKFLNNSNYENTTKKRYEDLFKKLKKNSEILNNIEETIKEKNIEELLALKKKIDELKLIKYYQRLKKYERGEFINLPNGLSYELCTKSEEETLGKSIPVPLGENEYFIKTHVGNDAKYTEYVSSLLEIKKLLENKGIKIRYCEYETWLVNKEFLRKYEETIKQKFGNQYKKTKRIQVLEQIEPAEVFYEIKKGSNPVDQQKKNGNTKKSPLRFIEGKESKKDLLEYLEQGDNKKEFNEANMRLDLKKLLELQKTEKELESGTHDIIEDETSKGNIEEKKEDKAPNNNKKEKIKIFRKIKLKIKKLFKKIKNIFKKK